MVHVAPGSKRCAAKTVFITGVNHVVVTHFGEHAGSVLVACPNENESTTSADSTNVLFSSQYITVVNSHRWGLFCLW